MTDKNNKKSKNIISIMLQLLILAILCMLIYKSQVEYGGDTRIKYTLMATHKDNGQIVLSKDNPVIYQDFVCNVPDLKKLQIEGAVNGSLSNSNLMVEVVGLDNGKTYYKKTGALTSFYNNKKKKKVYKLKDMPEKTEGAMLRVIMTLETESGGELILTANTKPGTTTAFNGNGDDHTNIIYRMRYGRVSDISGLFWFVCIWMLATLAILYVLIVVKHYEPQKWFFVAAMLIGMAVQWVIPVYGVPDEPWHMDTAYNLSNIIMRADKEPQYGTVLKRECDVITSDLLANDVESNSYYQLLKDSFDKPENTRLIRVAYVDSGNQVPDIVYLPAALGIITGRMLGLSGIMTYQLARIFSLIVYALIVWVAIRIIPFCNSLLSMVGLSLIALQQGASASYDSVINAFMLLFISLCFNLAYGKQEKNNKNTKIYIVLLVVTALFIATVKGGVYTPLFLLMLLIYNKKHIKKTNNKKVLNRTLIFAGVIVVVVGVVLWRFYPTLTAIFAGETLSEGTNYSLSYVLKHPVTVIYTFWRTIMKHGQTYMLGLFGGVLGWHNVKISWIFILPIVIGMLLLANVENERPPKDKMYKVISLGISAVTTVLVMFAMLLAFTSTKDSTIWGIQGRYFITFLPLVLSALSTKMINVSKERANGIVYIMLSSQMIALLQVVVAYI